MTFRAASVYPRYSDPLCTFVSLVPGKAEAAADKAADYEVSMGDCHCGRTACPYCDIIGGMEFSYSAKELFTAAELKEHRHALRQGEVICLYR